MQLTNESDFINLLLGIQNIQLEMMNTLKTLEENVSNMRNEITRISKREQPEPEEETTNFSELTESRKSFHPDDDDDSFKSEISICILPYENVSFAKMNH